MKTNPKALSEKPIIFNGEMVMAILEGRKTQTRRVIKSPDKWSHSQGAETIKRNPDNDPWYKDHIWSMRSKNCSWGDYTHERFLEFCPYRVDQEVWVRETWADVNSESGPAIIYRANGAMQCWEDFSTQFGPDYGAGPSMNYEKYPGDYSMWWTDLLNKDEHGEDGYAWKPSIHMPRWASRILLKVNNVRVERLNDISEDDAKAEGIQHLDMGWGVEGMESRTHCPVVAFADLWDSINASRGFGWDVNPWLWVIEFEVVKP